MPVRVTADTKRQARIHVNLLHAIVHTVASVCSDEEHVRLAMAIAGGAMCELELAKLGEKSQEEARQLSKTIAAELTMAARGPKRRRAHA